jgi:uncharacterized membrane protein HdeD (DUF308 family)
MLADMAKTMTKEVTQYWWAVALRGLAGVLFGIAAFVWPQITLAALVLLFGAYALVDGAFALGYAFTSGKPFRWLLALEGLTGILLGIVALVWPGITALALLYVIAAWAVVTGVLEIVAALELRKAIDNEWLLALGGLASIGFGVILAANPGAGALAMIWLIGAFALVFGVVLIALGLRLRAVGQQLTTPDQGGRRSTGGATQRA